MRYSLLYLALGGCDAGQCCSQPLISRRGGRCLLLTEITLPYQISVEMKFVCLRTVGAVNQTHTNPFFASPSLEGPSNGGLAGSDTRAEDLCCIAAILCIRAAHVRGNSCNGAANSDFSIGLIILSALPNDKKRPHCNSHVNSGRTEVFVIIRGDKLGKG